MDNPFAETARDPEQVVREVRRRAGEECADGPLPPDVLDRCVRDAVAAFWDSDVKTFVPLLALRRVRACIRVGTCDCDDF